MYWKKSSDKERQIICYKRVNVHTMGTSKFMNMHETACLTAPSPFIYALYEKEHGEHFILCFKKDFETTFG